MVYNGHREMGLVLAVNFFPKKTSPGPSVAVNSTFPYLVETATSTYSDTAKMEQNCL